jgi:hypothetical protein
MQRAILLALLLSIPTIIHARVIKWEGKAVSVFISTERLTRIEFPENLRSVFLSRSEIGVEREERSLYVRALAPDVEDALFVVGESGTTYELNLYVSDSSDSTIVISHAPKLLQADAERAGKVPALDLMRSMILGVPVSGYEVTNGNRKEVYRDASLLMKLAHVYRSPVLHGYVIEVENLSEMPVLLRVQDLDFGGMVAISAGDEVLQPRPKKASEVVQEKFRTYLYIVALPATGRQ